MPHIRSGNVGRTRFSGPGGGSGGGRVYLEEDMGYPTTTSTISTTSTSTTTAPVNIVTDPGFELLENPIPTEDGGGWWDEYETCTAQSTVKRSGDNAVMMDGDYSELNQSVTLEAYTEYIFSGYAYAAEGTDCGCAVGIYADDYNEDLAEHIDEDGGTGAWVYFEIEFRSGQWTEAILSVYDDGNVVYYDDISLVNTGAYTTTTLPPI